MSQPTAGERTTAAVSALAAIIILGAAVTAQQSRTTSVRPLAALESDLRFQLFLAHRTDGGRLAQRLVELNHTLDAWQRSPRTAADDRLLAEWLEEGIRRSMPGESGELPPPPQFGQPVVPRPAPAPVSPAAVEPLAPAAVAAPTPDKPGHVAPVEAPVEAPAEAPAAPSAAEEVEAAPSAAGRAEPVVAQPPPAAPVEPAPAVAAEPDRAAPHPPPPVEPARPPRVARKPVEVNLAELNARIVGYHQGLAAVDAAIVAADGELSLEQLTGLVEQVEQLANQHQLVSLYFESLTERERASVTAPRSLWPTVELVDRQRAAVERGREGDFLAPFDVAEDGDPSPLAVRLRALAERTRPSAVAP
jgi:hypothetical protein